jgi:rSAM/selenodomain-associated transferase 2
MTAADRRISIIVPARNEEAAIGETLRRLREPQVLEVIVVDGQSEDRTAEIARELADRVIGCGPGRARQMNRGAWEARGEILFFLHADTVPPQGFGRAIVAACAEPGVVGGRFDVELDDRRWPYRIVAAAINLRSRWSRLSTGDQGLFVLRSAFERLGGFPEQPLLEDLALSRALKRLGRIACLRERVRTSARRWQKDGLVRTILLMWTIRGLYALGVPPERLARFYRDVR